MTQAMASRPIVRRQGGVGLQSGLDLATLARVVVSSEQSVFSADNVFDGQDGPGGSCWIAAEPGGRSFTFEPYGPNAHASLTSLVIH